MFCFAFQVVALMSRTLHDLVVGELQQLSSKGGCDRNDRFNSYLRKTYNKTASLMANSCQAVAQIALATALQPNTEGNKNDVASAAFSYGKNLGIAFQLIDDYLDFSASATSLGKPAAADLKSVHCSYFLHDLKRPLFPSGWAWLRLPSFLRPINMKNWSHS